MLAMLSGIFARRPKQEDPLKRNPSALTDEMINQIGEAYLAKHPEKTFWHDTQGQAQALRDVKHEQLKERWLLLTEAYSRLPNRDVDLAKQIEKLFFLAFPDYQFKLTTEFYDPTSEDFSSVKELISIKEVSKKMNELLNEYDFSIRITTEGEIEMPEIKVK